MVSVICLAFKKEVGWFSERFRLDEGEECVVKVIISLGRPHGVEVDLELNKCSNLFVRANIYYDAGKRTYKRREIIKDCKYASFRACLNLSDSKNILLIKISKLKLLKSHVPTLASTINPRYEPVVKNTRKEPVICEKLSYLSWDMKDLLRSGYLSDIVLSDETNKIRAHKLILSARSPVFAKMLQHRMRESLENVITFKDMSIDVLKKLLDFMYTGRVEIGDMKMASSLYIAGDKYDIKGLKEICSEALMKVDLDNVIQVIILADLYQDEQLKQAALDFIHNNFSQVRALDSWNDFLTQNQALAIKVLSSELERRN